MKVILLEDIQGVGERGDVYDAKIGYARNYLLPRGLAIEATPQNLNELQQRLEAEEKRKEKDIANAETMKEELEKIEITLEAKAGESGKLFGAITNKEIATELNKKGDFKIDRKRIVLDKNIRDLGEYEVEIKLYREISATIKVKVIATKE